MMRKNKPFINIGKKNIASNIWNNRAIHHVHPIFKDPPYYIHP